MDGTASWWPVLVRRTPRWCAEDDLKATFSRKFGPVCDVALAKEKKNRDGTVQRTKNGLVAFQFFCDAERAMDTGTVALQGVAGDSRPAFQVLVERGDDHKNCLKRLYVHGSPAAFGRPAAEVEAALRRVYGRYGALREVLVPAGNEGRHTKGFAFVEFEEVSAATAAIQAGSKKLEMQGLEDCFVFNHLADFPTMTFGGGGVVKTKTSNKQKKKQQQQAPSWTQSDFKVETRTKPPTHSRQPAARRGAAAAGGAVGYFPAARASPAGPTGALLLPQAQPQLQPALYYPAAPPPAACPVPASAQVAPAAGMPAPSLGQPGPWHYPQVLHNQSPSYVSTPPVSHNVSGTANNASAGVTSHSRREQDVAALPFSAREVSHNGPPLPPDSPFLRSFSFMEPENNFFSFLDEDGVGSSPFLSSAAKKNNNKPPAPPNSGKANGTNLPEDPGLENGSVSLKNGNDSGILDITTLEALMPSLSVKASEWAPVSGSSDNIMSQHHHV